MRPNTIRSIFACPVFAATCVTLVMTQATSAMAQYEWTGDNNNNWSNNGNWTGASGSPNGIEDTVTLGQISFSDGETISLQGNTYDIASLAILNENYTLNNGALRVFGGIDQSTATAFSTQFTQVLNIDLEQAAAGDWDGDEDSTLMLNGALSGTGNVTVTNDQANGLVIQLNQPGSYSGTMTINSGNIKLGNGNALQNAAIVINNDNGLRFTTDTSFTIGTLAGTAALGVGGNTLTTSGQGNTTFSGTLSGGIGGSFQHSGSGTLTLAGAISGLEELRNVGSGKLVLTGGGSFTTLLADDGETQFNGATFNLTNDAGNTLFVRNGATTLIRNGATVQLTGASGTNRVVVVGDSTLSIAGAGTTLTAPRLDIGPSVSGGASVGISSQAIVNVDLLRLGDLGADDGASGQIGIVSNGAVFSEELQFFRRGTLSAVGGPLTTDRLTEGDGESTHTIIISDTASGSALTIGVNGGNSAFSGRIEDAILSGSIRKEGAGTLELGGANTFSGGVTINGGTLLANNSFGTATGTGGVAVSAGATLGGTGSAAGTTTVESGGTIAPGASIGTLTVDNVTFANGSTLDIEFMEAMSAIQFDKLVVNQTATLGGTLNLTSLGGTIAAGNTFVILAATNLVGTFDQVITPGRAMWTIEYDTVAGQVRVGPCLDADGDGVCNANDICPGFDDSTDGDGDGVPDGCDPCPIDNPDDTDGDGVCDSADVCPGSDDNADGDNDGIPDGCDICPGGDDHVDSDADGVPDFCDPCPIDNPDDTDGDGVCNSGDLCPGFDDNADGDNDGIPNGCDACPNRKSGDVNGDSWVTVDDVSAFASVLLNPDSATSDELCAADMNEDGVVNGLDVQGMTELMLGS